MGHQPADTLFLMDGLPRTGSNSGNVYAYRTTYTLQDCYTNGPTGGKSTSGNGTAGGTTNFDRYRHNGKLNILFLDYHAEKFDISPTTNGSTLSAVQICAGFPGKE